MLKIYLIAGEASGDNIGAKLMAALRSQNADIEFYGIGGPKMQALGLSSLFPMQDLALMGFLEIIPHIPRLFKRIRQTIVDICQLQPDVVITIDSPGFSFRIAKAIKNKIAGKLVHYVAPTVWAYKPERAKKIAQIYDHLLVILPFEAEYFLKEGLSTTFVGHPAIEDLHIVSKTLFRTKFNIPQENLLLCLAPGSRAQEIKMLLPIFLDALKKIVHPPITIAVPTQPQFKSLIGSYDEQIILVDEQDKESLFSAADLALTKSGTITTELAFYQLPMIVAHKVNGLSYWLLKKLIKIHYVTIINLLAQQEIIPELLQDRCNSDLIAQYLREAIASRGQAAWRQALEANLVKLKVNGTIPSQLAAKTILSLVYS